MLHNTLDPRALCRKIFSLFPDLTYQELGEALGLSKQTISAWKEGRSAPRLPQLAKIVELAGISWDELFVPPAEHAPGAEGLREMGAGIPVVGVADACDPSGRARRRTRKSRLDPAGGLFAFEVRGEGMEPLVRDGQRVLVSDARRTPRPGTAVIAEIRERDGEKLTQPELVCRHWHGGEAALFTAFQPKEAPPFTSRDYVLWEALGVWFAEG